MRKTLALAALALLAATSAYALNKGETEFENNGWFRYTNVAPGLDFSKSTRSDFSLERGYIRLSHQWTNQLFSKMTVDVLSSGAYSDGASIRLKEAYVDFTLPVTFVDAKITPGLQKDYFSLIYLWDYTHLEKSLADKEGIVASADYGLTLNGYLPAGLGEFEVGGYNGAGYKKAFTGSTLNPMNTNFDWVANLHLTPIGGVMVGASVMTQASDQSNYKNGSGTYWANKSTTRAWADTANLNRTGIAPCAKFTLGPVSLLGEYISYNYTREYHYWNCDTLGKVTDSTKLAKDKKYAMNGFSLVPVVSLLPGRKLELVGRYDMWNVAADGVKDTLKSHTMYGAGVNWHFFRREKGKPGAELQLFWQHEQPAATSAKPTDQIMAQVRFEWTGLITPQ